MSGDGIHQGIPKEKCNVKIRFSKYMNSLKIEPQYNSITANNRKCSGDVGEPQSHGLHKFDCQPSHH
jgi:hypothetical protein